MTQKKKCTFIFGCIRFFQFKLSEGGVVKMIFSFSFHVVPAILSLYREGCPSTLLSQDAGLTWEAQLKGKMYLHREAEARIGFISKEGLPTNTCVLPLYFSGQTYAAWDLVFRRS